MTLAALVLAGSSCGDTADPLAAPEANRASHALTRHGEALAAAWYQRHDELERRLIEGPADLLFVGDSITHYWEPSELWPSDGSDVWKEFYAPRNALNLGVAGDQTGHLLWRLEHASLEAISPRLTVVMIGTNNLSFHTAPQIAEGVIAVVRTLRRRLPRTEVLLLAIFPRGATLEAPERQLLARANELISEVADGEWVHYLDINQAFLNADGEIDRRKLPDLVHLNELGYRAWAEAMESKLVELLAG